MKYIYLVNYWVPFPSSEYGGVQVVIAHSRQEAADFIKDASDIYYLEEYPDHMKRITDAVAAVKTFKVISEDEVGIVEDFTT